MSKIKKYCEGLDCAICDEKEPCIYKIANDLQEQLSSKEQEYDELKKTVDDLLHKPEIQDKIIWKIDNEALLGSKDAWIYKLEQTLTEIKGVLQFYNNTTIGVDKGNGIFELEVSNDNIGKLIYCYDTNPAKEALQKISEVENGHTKED